MINRLFRIALILLAASLLSAQVDETLYNGMKWRLVGPFRGGRVLAVAGVAGNPNIYYFGAAAGGVWRTSDGGLNWTPVFDKESVSSIGALAVAPSDPNVIYAGTGEACIRNDISYGDGVYKSTDGGKTWKNVGLRDSRHIGHIAVHPSNPDIVYVAALGHAFGPNAERGVFRSLDGGKTWEKVLYKDERTGAIDISLDPANPRILFAALWEAHRTPYSLTSGGPGSGLYKSTDGGSTWKRLEGHGLPGGILGRIGVSVSGADSNRVYAMIEAKEGNFLYRSDDGGDNWQVVNRDPQWVRPWYFNHVLADPRSADTVYVLDLGLYRSTDGGRLFTNLLAPHGDHHALWIDPSDPRRVINGNDGGATITTDGGKSWTPQDNQPTAQFYHVAADNRFPYWIYGAQQDNTSVALRTRSDFGAIDERAWHPVGGGECGYVVPDPRDPEIVFAGAQNGLLTRFNGHTGQAQLISPQADTQRSHAAADGKHRLQWTAPLIISPHDAGVVYVGGEVLFRSDNGGMSWTVISPDLTRNDKAKQQSSGGPLTADDSSAEYYDTIFAIAESPVQKDLIWAGSDDGLIHLTRDGGKNWSNVTPRQMPEWSLVSIVDASPFDPGTAYVAVDRHKLDDLKPYIYKTTDFGKIWTAITNGIPEGAYVHAVRQDPKRKGQLYAGTETGAYVSFDDGAHWQPLQLNLPRAPVYDLAVHDRDLVAATHGRAFWVLDDLAPLRQINASLAAADAHLYQPSPAHRIRTGRGLIRGPGNAGQNPPTGAVIDYYLKSAPQQPVTLEILDGSGRTVRRFSSQQKREGPPSPYPWMQPTSERLPANAGMNRFVWNLRYEPPRDVPGMTVMETRSGGPLAPPGTYQVKLTAEGKTATAPLEVQLDPRSKAPAADLQKQFEFAIAVRERIDRSHEMVNQIRDLHSQLQALRKRLGPERKAIADAADDLEQRMSTVADGLVQPKSTTIEGALVFPVMLSGKLGYLQDMAESADSAPPQQAQDALQELTARLDNLASAWKAIQEKQLVALDEMLRKENIPVLSVGGTGTNFRASQ